MFVVGHPEEFNVFMIVAELFSVVKCSLLSNLNRPVSVTFNFAGESISKD